jgi:hypothetical protein
VTEQIKRHFERQKLVEILQITLPEPQINDPKTRAAIHFFQIRIEAEKAMKERYAD